MGSRAIYEASSGQLDAVVTAPGLSDGPYGWPHILCLTRISLPAMPSTIRG
jgi:hypothetical protein